MRTATIAAVVGAALSVALPAEATFFNWATNCPHGKSCKSTKAGFFTYSTPKGDLIDIPRLDVRLDLPGFCKQPPKNDRQKRTCPIKWYWHDKLELCVPPFELADAECGAGHEWHLIDRCCKPAQPPRGVQCKNGWFFPLFKQCIDLDLPERECPFKDQKCPDQWVWHESGLNKAVGYCVPKNADCPSKPKCETGFKWLDSHRLCSRATKSLVSPPAPASTFRLSRKSFTEPTVDLTRHAWDDENCLSNSRACPVFGARFAGMPAQFDCMSENDIESCGGCPNLGDGDDCNEIPNIVKGRVGCNSGRCEVYQCKTGFKVANGNSCVKI